METAVRKATRLEYRPPKEKHLQSKYEATCAVHVLKQLTFLHTKKKSTQEFDVRESS